MSDPVKISLGKAAFQSSFSIYSSKDDPLGAIDGSKSGSFSFHTQEEINPWWMLDLGNEFPVTSIKVFNRCDAARNRVRNSTISVYKDDWQTVYTSVNEFGGMTDNSPLEISFGTTPIVTRYIKFSLIGQAILHLDEVEVFGKDLVAPYRARLEASPAPSRDAKPKALTASQGAIVVLTRGYEDNASYASLIARNAAIYEHVNKSRTEQYPLIIWHEGNISRSQQEYIRSFEKNDDVRFVDVSEQFKLPSHIDTNLFEEGWPLGYRLMCKFNTIDIWERSEEYKYVLRIDEDCILTELSVDPFIWAEAANIDVGFSLLSAENHELTNASLPFFAAAYQSLRLGQESEALDPYNHLFPYSNVMISRTEFFLDGRVNKFLREVTFEQHFYSKRWGDLPVLGVALNLFSSPARIEAIPGLAYRHESHAIIIHSGDARPQSFEAFGAADIPINLSLEETERALLARFITDPKNSGVRWRLAEVSSRLGRHQLVARMRTSISTSSIGSFLEKASICLGSRDYAAAISCYSSMFDENYRLFEREARDFVDSMPEVAGARWIATEGLYGDASSITDIFSTIYEKNIWGGGSGGGSFVERVIVYAGFVQHLLRRYNIRSVCDIGCGDWQFSQYIDFSSVVYAGFDVVNSVVIENRRKFERKNISFFHADASTFQIPECDLLICKDVLQHLSNEAASKIIQQRSVARVWLVTNDFAKINAESRDGDTRPIDPTSPPFALKARPVLSFDGKVSFLSDA